MAVNFFEIPWVIAKIRGQEFLFTDVRVARDSIPACLFVYEVRGTDANNGEPCEVSEKILVNFYGTLISREPMKRWDKEEEGRHFLFFRFSDEPEWYEGENGISDDPVGENGEPLEPHFAPIPEDWDCNYEEIEGDQLTSFIGRSNPPCGGCELTENQRLWFSELLREAAKDARGAASNERLWAKGSQNEAEACQHEANALENADYADFLESLIP